MWTYDVMSAKTLPEAVLTLAVMLYHDPVHRVSRAQIRRVDRLPRVDYWDLSDAGDGSRVTELREGRRYYYINHWTRYIIDGYDPDYCVRVAKDSEFGKLIAALRGNGGG